MTFKLPIVFIALILVFTGVYADHPFSIKGRGYDWMYVPSRDFQFTIDPGSPSYYDVGIIKMLEVTIGGCYRHLGLNKLADGSISIQSGPGNPWINLKEKKTIDMCVSGSQARFCGVDEQGTICPPGCSITYVPLTKGWSNGFMVQMIVAGDLPSDFEIRSPYGYPGPTTPKSTTTTTAKTITTGAQSTTTSTSTNEEPTSSVEPSTAKLTDSTGFPQTWHIIAISVGLLLLSLLSSGSLLFIVLRLRKKSKGVGEQTEETQIGQSPNAFDPRVINLPSNVAKPKVMQPEVASDFY